MVVSEASSSSKSRVASPAPVQVRQAKQTAATEEAREKEPEKEALCPCGNRFMEDSVFCRKCGRKRKELGCRCGHKFDGDEKYCPNCGSCRQAGEWRTKPAVRTLGRSLCWIGQTLLKTNTLGENELGDAASERKDELAATPAFEATDKNWKRPPLARKLSMREDVKGTGWPHKLGSFLESAKVTALITALVFAHLVCVLVNSAVAAELLNPIYRPLGDVFTTRAESFCAIVLRLFLLEQIFNFVAFGWKSISKVWRVMDFAVIVICLAYETVYGHSSSGLVPLLMAVRLWKLFPLIFDIFLSYAESAQEQGDRDLKISYWASSFQKYASRNPVAAVVFSLASLLLIFLLLYWSRFLMLLVHRQVGLVIGLFLFCHIYLAFINRARKRTPALYTRRFGKGGWFIITVNFSVGKVIIGPWTIDSWFWKVLSVVAIGYLAHHWHSA